MNTDEIASQDDSEIGWLKANGHSAFAGYFEAYRERLKKVVSGRISRKLSGRMDASDIVQETYVDAATRLDTYLAAPTMPLFGWLTFLAKQNVRENYRRHCGAKKRNAALEVVNDSRIGSNPLQSLTESAISPGSYIAQMDLAETVCELIAGMPTPDREILTLRHIQQLSIAEAADRLQISVDSAKKRHVRAICRLQALSRGLNGSSVS